MRVTIIGAAGMIGRKLAERIAATGAIGGTPVDAMTLVDVIEPDVAADFKGTREVFAADLTQSGTSERVIANRPDIIVHLAAIVSGEAEADFDKGYRVNLDGTRALLEAIQSIEGYCPRVIYASSLAVFGAPLPDVIPDTHQLTPLTSYGAQKAMGELLLNDYSRRGFLDGVGIRFPTICIRPGKRNKAASSFFSGILREPLNGVEAILPVEDDVRHWFASPRAAVGYIEHAATMDTAQLGAQRCMTMPGVSATVGEQIEALRAVAGDGAVALIRRAPDPAVAQIIAGWPRAFDTARALAAGFVAEKSFQEIIAIYLEDEMGQPALKGA
ncbi:nucleoside-diphosphate-sugar epimerase [Sulfitobacter undariae]|uniref:Nucleoside-diphosphate-sugar epimerase n=1 Tax=Sulfitobacter undariae TaxID=1563671 RepID=A0A7W6GZN5_9RHOB|nr:D-erythronate dehydrogenase [Sulfitobacter undariae]MBB3992778.1 nucleoside-diphosphate-sugar epimerase [Sulfitobacter undariae]